jgi:hypothetical protein
VYVKPMAPRSIGGVLDDGLRLWRASLPKTWQLAFLAQLLVAIPLILFRLQLASAPIAQTPNSVSAMNAANAQYILSLIKSPVFLLGYIVAVLATLGFYNAIISRMAAISANSDLSLGQSLSNGFRLIPRQLLLLVILILGSAVTGVIAALLAGMVSAAITRSAAGIGPILIAVVMLCVLGFFMVRILLAFNVLVVENAGAFESVKVSWGLTKGNWWRCAVILTVLIIIVIVLSIVVGLVSGLVLVGLGPASTVGIILNQLMSVLVNAVLGPVYPAVLLAIYYDLRMRKEGGDLAGRVNAL